MTLNITVLTQAVIYQSADFRLTDIVTGKPFPDPSPKTVTLTYSSWNGFITYTGLGNWRKRDVSDYLVEWLTGAVDPSIAEVASLVADKGTELLRDVELFHPRRKHTFTLVGFTDEGPRVYVISNFEDCFGAAREGIDDHLTVTTRLLGRSKKAIVIVTGYKSAVTTNERRELGSVAGNYPGDGLRIRRRMARINADAAPRSHNRVSVECVVLSFRADGTGVMMLDRDAMEAPGQFPHIMNGVNINKAIAEALKSRGIDFSKGRIVQAASASFRPGQKVDTSPKAECNYAVVNPESSSGYRLTEIDHEEFKLVAPKDVNERGQIVGTGREGLRSDQPQNIPWSYFDGKVTRLGYTGLAAAVNDKGAVVAVLQGPSAPPPSWQRAALYDANNLVELPLYDSGHDSQRSDSEARAINNSSLMVGSVAVQDGKADTLEVFAAAFRVGEPVSVFRGLRPEYGCRAISVTEAGHVLLMAGMGPSDVRSVLWNPVDDVWSFVGDDSTNVYPIAITDDDVVLGQARNSHHQPVAVVCRSGGSWQRLGTPDGWIPIDVNNKGEVLGRVMTDLLERPWLQRADGRIVLLPYVTDHHTTPSKINNLGIIVGGASADNDVHALMWSQDLGEG